MHVICIRIDQVEIRSGIGTSYYALLLKRLFSQIADTSVWQEVISKEKMPKNDDIIEQNEPIPADPAGNVCSFGLLMLEIISGKPLYCEESGSLVNMVMTTKTLSI
jgi:hypothetical protein